MRRAPLLLLALLALACQRADQEEHGPAPRAPAVPGMETVVVKVEAVRDIVGAFGQVAAEGEPPPVRDARSQLAEAEARRRLAEQRRRAEQVSGGGGDGPRGDDALDETASRGRRKFGFRHLDLSHNGER